MPLIASVTLTSRRSEVIGDALRSVVGWVDACILVDLGMDGATLDVARVVCGRKLRVVPGPDMTLPFCEWRNHGLEVAARMGYRWAVTLDTDERIQAPAGIRGALKRSPHRLIQCMDRDLEYFKERFFRLPFPGRWVGNVHEYVTGCESVAWTGCTFTELPKTEKQLRDRAADTLSRLLDEMDAHPEDPRWRYYVGDCYRRLGRHEEARIQFQEAIRLDPASQFAIAARIHLNGRGA